MSEKITLQQLRELSEAKAAPVLSKAEQAKRYGEALSVKAIYTHEVQLLDQKTNLLASHTRVLFDIGESAMLSFVSQQAASFVDLLRDYEPTLKFNPPITVRVDPVETRSGYRTYSFAVL